MIEALIAADNLQRLTAAKVDRMHSLNAVYRQTHPSPFNIRETSAPYTH
jgi:hypothetical protein